MSQLRRSSTLVTAAMSATHREKHALAHPLHDTRVVLRMAAIATLLTLAGCPSLTVETLDGGVNSPPAITSITADEQVLPDSGTVNFASNVAGSQMVVGLLDSDVGDTLYVRVFVDYTVQDPEPPRTPPCDAQPTGARERTCTLDITGMCPDIGNGFQLTVQVFDRKLAEGGIPLHKRMEETNPPGLTTNRSYILNCLGDS